MYIGVEGQARREPGGAILPGRACSACSGRRAGSKSPSPPWAQASGTTSLLLLWFVVVGVDAHCSPKETDGSDGQGQQPAERRPWRPLRLNWVLSSFFQPAGGRRDRVLNR
jgi:hypothetical protein